MGKGASLLTTRGPTHPLLLLPLIPGVPLVLLVAAVCVRGVGSGSGRAAVTSLLLVFLINVLLPLLVEDDVKVSSGGVGPPASL